MAERLVPCAGCSRHVRCSEAACPFCGATAFMSPQPSREPLRRLAAAAAVAAGVTGLTGCRSDVSAGSFYGASPVLEGAEDAGSDVASNAIECRTSAACLPGQVCCGTIDMTSSCQAGPCPSTMLGPLQLCGMSAECLAAGDTCGPLAADPAVMTCNAPSDDDGSSSSSSSSGGGDGGNADGDSSSDGDSGGDTSISDAPPAG
jgi:hypothetical protein